MTRFVSEAQFEGEIASLCEEPRPKLIERWQALYGAEPKGISRVLLARWVAYGIQAQRYGGCSRALDRRLRKLARTAFDDGASVERALRTRTELKSGTRLVREWNGSTHVVEVVEGGYHWNERTYGSLSAIARAITGARWSGPRFFGVD